MNVDAGQGGNLLGNIALVDSPGDDPNEAALPSGSLRGGAAIATTNVGSETDFTITKSDSVDPVTAGETLIYSLLVTTTVPPTPREPPSPTLSPREPPLPPLRMTAKKREVP